MTGAHRGHREGSPFDRFAGNRRVEQLVGIVGKVADVLTCDTCPNVALCGSAIVTLTSHLEPKALALARESTASYGVNVDTSGAVCPRGLVKEAGERLEGGVFWIGHHDSLYTAPQAVQTLDAVVTAAEDLARILREKRLR